MWGGVGSPASPMGQKTMKVTAIIVAAGTGSRMAGEVPKQFLLLDDKPVVTHVLLAFEVTREVQEVIIIIPKGYEEHCRKEWIEDVGDGFLVYAFPFIFDVDAEVASRRQFGFSRKELAVDLDPAHRD